MRRLVLLYVCLVGLMVGVNAQDTEPTATDVPELVLDIWIPAPLIADTNSDAYSLLVEHSDEFTSNNNITINYRIKAVGTVGGIISTIRSGSVVAPGALPDVTLIQRADLISAQSPELLQSMETLFSTALLNDIDDAIELGQIPTSNGLELFGLPYFIDMLVTTYTRASVDIDDTITFDDVLTYADNFMFPAGRANDLNQTFYLQYLEAGGVSPRNGTFTINTNALQTVYEFYEAATAVGIVTPDVFDYDSPSAYRTDYINDMESFNFAVVNTSEYLSLRQQDSSLQMGAIPTSSGDPLPSATGWVWVMVTPDLAQQELVVRYLNWMMQPDFHAALSRALNQIPAQDSALEDSLPADVDPLFVDSLITNAILPLPDSEGGAVPRAMQEALIRVINGEITAEEATDDVVEQFATD